MLDLKTIIKAVPVIPVMLLCLFSGPLHGEERLSFSWAFIHKTPAGPPETLDFAAPEQVAEGDLLKIYLELNGGAFVYLYLFDSRQDFYLVFPPVPGFYNGEIPAAFKSYIPEGRKWFSLDGLRGTERFYLLASRARLTGLEELTERFLMTRDPGLKIRLQTELEETADKLSEGAVYGVERLPIQPAGAGPAETVRARKITTADGYGRILDLVNK